MELREDNSSNYAGNLSFSLSIPMYYRNDNFTDSQIIKDSGTNDMMILVLYLYIFMNIILLGL